MKHAVLVHGFASKSEYYNPDYPSLSNCHWFPWLQKQLLMHEIAAQTPEIPRVYELNYNSWVRELERYDIGPHTQLVGHSCGGGFLVRWLSEHKAVHVGRVVLVAPWLGPTFEDVTRLKPQVDAFFHFAIDSLLAGRTERLVVFNSDDDHPAIQQSVQTLGAHVRGLDVREFHGYGHFCLGDKMKSEEFPELLHELIG